MNYRLTFKQLFGKNCLLATDFHQYIHTKILNLTFYELIGIAWKSIKANTKKCIDGGIVVSNTNRLMSNKIFRHCLTLITLADYE